MNKKKINAFDCICVTDVKILPINQIDGLTHTPRHSLKSFLTTSF